MPKLFSSVSSTILFRVGNSDEMEKYYEEKYIDFSCPANWVDKAFRAKDSIIGDYLECVFARVHINDPILNTLEKYYKDNLLKTIYSDGTCFLRFIPSLLTPTLCFNVFCATQYKNEIDLHEFSKKMGIDCKRTRGLVILNTKAFYMDLLNSIPDEVLHNTILSSERFSMGFSTANPIFVANVDYKNIRNRLFYFDEYKAIFTKHESYAFQNEQRIIIPSVCFKHFATIGEEYYYKNNILHINLPHLHEYAKLA